MISKLRKTEWYIIMILVMTTLSIFAHDAVVNITTEREGSIEITENTSINFKNDGFVNYANIGDEPSVVYIDGVKKDITNALTINVDSSSTINPFDQNQQFHVNASGNGKDVYAINLSNAKADFGMNFNGEVFGEKSEVTNVGDDALNSAAIYLPTSGSNFNDDRDKSTIDFGNTRVNIKSNITGITSGSPCCSLAVGIPELNMNGANSIVLKKGITNDGSSFTSSASATAIDSGYQFDKVNSTVFGCGKISVSGLAEGEGCSQLCNFDLSNFDLSKDEVTSISPRYTSVIGAAHVTASDNAKNVKINQFNNLHVKNTPKTAVSTAGVDSYYSDSYAVVLGGGYVGADLTHGADDNKSCKVSQFNDITIDSMSGTLEAEAVGHYDDEHNNRNSATVIGCAGLNTTIGDTEGDPIKNCHISQFNNISIGEIYSSSSEDTILSSLSECYVSVIGSAYDELTINGNATNSTVQKFNKLNIGKDKGIFGKLEAKSTSSFLESGLQAATIGVGHSDYNLKGSDSNVQRFNDVAIGDIANVAVLSSHSKQTDAVVIGSTYEKLTIGADNSKSEEFNRLKIGVNSGISGELRATCKFKSAVIGLGCSQCDLSMDSSAVCRFNNIEIGNITKNAKLNSSSTQNDSDAVVIGSAYDELTMNENATNSTIEEFSDLKVGRICGELNANCKRSATVLGSGWSEYTLNGSYNNVLRFNNMAIGGIDMEAKLSNIGTIDASNSENSSIIGNACEIFTINASNSKIGEFNKLNIGNISGELSANGKNQSTIIGSGWSEYTLNGNDSNVERFNYMTIGDITEEANLSSISNSDNSTIIGTAGERFIINASNSTIREFNGLKIGEGKNTGISGKLEAECKNQAAVIGSGWSKYTLNGSDSKVQRFNDVTIGNINGEAKLSSSSNSSNTAVIGSAYDKLEINGNATNSTIEIFNNLKVGEISGGLNTTGKNSSVVLGSGWSKYTLNGSDNKILRFNDITIGGIAEGAKLIGTSNSGNTAVIGSAYDELIVNENATNSTIEEFSNLKVGGISGELNTTGKNSSVVLGSGQSNYTLNGNDNKIRRFNDITIGGIAEGAKLIGTSNSGSTAVIGSASNLLIINSEKSTVEEFSNLKVAEKKGIFGKLNATSKWSASVLGSGHSECTLNGSGSKVQRFNDIIIDGINSGAKLSSTSNSGCSTVIGNAYDTFTIGGENSKIEEFNKLKIGNISGELSANGKNQSTIIGSGWSEYTLNGNDNKIRRFNDVTIGDIAEGATLKSTATTFDAVLIGNVRGALVINENATNSTIEEFNRLKVGNISGELRVNCMRQSIAIGSGSTNYIYNGNNVNIKRFNDITIGDITVGSNLTSNSTNNCATVIGLANNDNTMGVDVENLTIEEFNNLKVGMIYGNLSAATENNSAAVIGSGCSSYNLNGSNSNVKRFNYIAIGDIAEGAELNSTAKTYSAVIGSANETFTINAENSTLKEFSNLKVGNIAGTLKSEVIGNGNVYGSAIGCSCLDVNGVADIKNVKMFSDVSVQFQKGAIASSVGASSNGGTIYLNTLGGQYNGYYGEENNDIADGMRFYFNGVGKSSDNDIVIAALEHDNDAPKTYSLTDECRSFAMGPNFQINVGRNRVIDSSTDRETRFSIENGGVRSGIPGTLRILGNISLCQEGDYHENTIMRIDGGWDAQCFGNVEYLQTIDIVEGTLSLMGSGNACKAELGQAIKRIDDTGLIGDGFKGKLILDDEVMLLRFGVSSNIDAETNEKFASKAFRSSDGRVQIRNDGQDDAGMLNLDGGKFSLNIKSRENIPSNSCFYVIRVDNPHDEDTDGNLINVDPAWYEVSDENFNEGGYFGNVKMYKITKDGKSIVDGKIGILSEEGVHAYKICDQSDQLLGIAIGPEEYGVNDLETITDSVSKSNSGVAVAQDAVTNVSNITNGVCTHMSNMDVSDYLSNNAGGDYLASIISGERQARYIGGGNYALSTQYKNRYSLNPKLFFSIFGEHGHQDKISGLGYNYNLYGFTVGGRLAKYLQSGASIKFGLFGSFSDNTTKYCGEKSHLGMRNNQKMYFGGIFGSYEDYDISDFRTNLSVIVGGGRFKNKTWTRITDGGKVRAKFNSSDFHASADFVKNIINIGNSDFHCGPWMALSYDHIHENGHDVVCNGENIAAVSSTRFDFLDTTLGINFEKNILYSPEKNISGRIFAKAGWFCRPVRSHSSCTIRADGVDPVNSEFRFSDRNAAIVSGGFKFEFNKKWELSASITSRIAKHHWLINGNALIGYSF